MDGFSVYMEVDRVFDMVLKAGVTLIGDTGVTLIGDTYGGDIRL